jgi:gamma-glutamylcysteine synthetase
LFVALEPQAFERAIQKWLRAQQKTGWREIDDALAILYSNANNGSMSIANETIDVEDGGTTLS